MKRIQLQQLKDLLIQVSKKDTATYKTLSATLATNPDHLILRSAAAARIDLIQAVFTALESGDTALLRTYLE